MILSFLTISFDSNSYETNQSWLNDEARHCKTAIDSLTNKSIYLAVEQQAVHAGGRSALMKEYQIITLDSIQEYLDTKFVIAFIVEPNGQIIGARVNQRQNRYRRTKNV